MQIAHKSTIQFNMLGLNNICMCLRCMFAIRSHNTLLWLYNQMQLTLRPSMLKPSATGMTMPEAAIAFWVRSGAGTDEFPVAAGIPAFLTFCTVIWNRAALTAHQTERMRKVAPSTTCIQRIHCICENRYTCKAIHMHIYTHMQLIYKYTTDTVGSQQREQGNYNVIQNWVCA